MPRTHILTRLFDAVSLPMACELHKRLRDGCTQPETRRMLRYAMRQASIGLRAR
jgi:hypothetical protein